MTIFNQYLNRYTESKEEEYTLQEYLDICKNDPSAYASAAEGMLMAIGEPELVDTHKDPRLSRLFSNKVIKIYAAFKKFYGMEETIEKIVSYFRHAAQGLEEKKQILYLLGPVGGGKSLLAEKLKSLMENCSFYAYPGGLCLANQGLLEFVEIFKAPIKVLHPLLSATQEGNFMGTEGLSAIAFEGVIFAHSDEFVSETRS